MFQLRDMLNLCFNLNESQPIYPDKRYAYRKKALHKIVLCKKECA